MGSEIVPLRGQMVGWSEDRVAMLARAYGAGLSRRRAAEYAGITEANLMLWFNQYPQLEGELLALKAATTLTDLEQVRQKARADGDSNKLLNLITKIDPDFFEKTRVEHSFNEEHGKLEVVFRKDWPSG